MNCNGNGVGGCLGALVGLLLVDLLLKLACLPLFGVKFSSWWPIYSKCLVVIVIVAAVATVVVQIVVTVKKKRDSTEDGAANGKVETGDK